MADVFIAIDKYVLANSLDFVMSRLIINTGTGPNSKDGDTVRNAFTKVNENFNEIYSTLTLLSGGSIGDSTVNIKGNVSSLDDVLLVDATSGKITTAAIPDNVPQIYEFQANFNSSGNLTTISNLPNGWSYTKDNNLATIVHNTGRTVKMVSYWGYSTEEAYRLRYPTAGYEARVNLADFTTKFKINITASVTGADLQQHALVVVTF